MPATSETRTAADVRRSGLIALGVMVLVMWVAEVVDILLDHRLDYRRGIEPREADGLDGIVFAPFLHADFAHLIGNTVPFLILGAAIAWYGAARLLTVTAVIALVAGLGTWLLGAPGTVHIGASSLVFGYAGYLVSRGVFSRRVGQIVLGAAVLLIWGGTLLTGFVPQTGVSWQGHLFGAIGGVLAAALLDRHDRAGATGRSHRG
ncbi:rhomboid family intramembrane serine protease [Nocardioides insulae]|uniref:rhomboid family intramembrane serine protease n=1 Tax=Nocardioides insulae TaxID=394734 RepID=UPI00042244DA|nr:rhomboid family intramembrane serine protease [Nocardioides insulae]